MRIRVLVVEDEPSMRAMYSTLLDWEANGFELVGCVQNGEKALAFMERTRTDIVITDLKMPKMSGIELIRTCQKEFPLVKFIVVSGYDDFTLVKEAFHLGIKDYVLKYEIDGEVIISILHKIASEIREEQQIEKQNKIAQEELVKLRELENVIGNSHYVLHEMLLKELIWNKGNASQVLERMKKCQMTLEESHLHVAVLTIHGYFEYEKGDEWQENREMLKYAFLNILEEICRERLQSSYVFCNMPNEYIIICSGIRDSDVKYFEQLYKRIEEALELCFSLTCSLGVSDEAERFSELINSYTNAKLACEYSYVFGGNKLVFFNNIKESNKNIQTADFVLKLKEALSSLNSNKIRDVVYELRINPNMIGSTQIQTIKNLFYLYYIEIQKFAETEGLVEQLNKELNFYYEAERSCSLPKMNKWLIETLSSIAGLFNHEHIIVKVKSYIKKHYKENITLTSVAHNLQISESHLSRVFKKEQNMTFSQYVLKTRMDAATELLKNSNLKIYEIASEVGYSNPEQFSRMFKKVTGRSPKSFLKR